MNKKIQISIILLFLVSVTSVIYVLLNSNNKDRVVFMDNIKVFEAFQMKKDYDKILEKDLLTDKINLDELGETIKTENSVDKEQFLLKKQLFEKKFAELSQKYTREVYDTLNVYIKHFGEKMNYDFILSSTNDGNIMFVSDKIDITKQIISYINLEYKK